MSTPVANQPLPEVETYLPEDFHPGVNHVIIGRGEKAYNHPGNIVFRDNIQSRLEEYSQAKTKNVKSLILVDTVRKVHITGGFVKEDVTTGRWMTAGTFLAREKVSQTFRDILSDGYKSSKASKKKCRLEQQLGLPSPSSSWTTMTASCTTEVKNADIETMLPTAAVFKRRRQDGGKSLAFPPPTQDQNQPQSSEGDLFFPIIPGNGTNLAEGSVHGTDDDDRLLLTRMHDIFSTELEDIDTTALEPTPFGEENFDIDQVFQSATAPTVKSKKGDIMSFFGSTANEHEFRIKEVPSNVVFDMPDIFFPEDNCTHIKAKTKDAFDCSSHSADSFSSEFVPLRYVASARTA